MGENHRPTNMCRVAATSASASSGRQTFASSTTSAPSKKTRLGLAGMLSLFIGAFVALGISALVVLLLCRDCCDAGDGCHSYVESPGVPGQKHKEAKPQKAKNQGKARGARGNRTVGAEPLDSERKIRKIRKAREIPKKEQDIPEVLPHSKKDSAQDASSTDNAGSAGSGSGGSEDKAGNVGNIVTRNAGNMDSGNAGSAIGVKENADTQDLIPESSTGPSAPSLLQKIRKSPLAALLAFFLVGVLLVSLVLLVCERGGSRLAEENADCGAEKKGQVGKGASHSATCSASDRNSLEGEKATVDTVTSAADADASAEERKPFPKLMKCLARTLRFCTQKLYDYVPSRYHSWLDYGAWLDYAADLCGEGLAACCLHCVRGCIGWASGLVDLVCTVCCDCCAGLCHRLWQIMSAIGYGLVWTPRTLHAWTLRQHVRLIGGFCSSGPAGIFARFGLFWQLPGFLKLWQKDFSRHLRGEMSVDHPMDVFDFSEDPFFSYRFWACCIRLCSVVFSFHECHECFFYVTNVKKHSLLKNVLLPIIGFCLRLFFFLDLLLMPTCLQRRCCQEIRKELRSIEIRRGLPDFVTRRERKYPFGDTLTYNTTEWDKAQWEWREQWSPRLFQCLHDVLTMSLQSIFGRESSALASGFVAMEHAEDVRARHARACAEHRACAIRQAQRLQLERRRRSEAREGEREKEKQLKSYQQLKAVPRSENGDIYDPSTHRRVARDIKDDLEGQTQTQGTGDDLEDARYWEKDRTEEAVRLATLEDKAQVAEAEAQFHNRRWVKVLPPTIWTKMAKMLCIASDDRIEEMCTPAELVDKIAAAHSDPLGSWKWVVPDCPECPEKGLQRENVENNLFVRVDRPDTATWYTYKTFASSASEPKSRNQFRFGQKNQSTGQSSLLRGGLDSLGHWRRLGADERVWKREKPLSDSEEKKVGESTKSANPSEDPLHVVSTRQVLQHLLLREEGLRTLGRALFCCQSGKSGKSGKSDSGQEFVFPFFLQVSCWSSLLVGLAGSPALFQGLLFLLYETAETWSWISLSPRGSWQSVYLPQLLLLLAGYLVVGWTLYTRLRKRTDWTQFGANLKWWWENLKWWIRISYEIVFLDENGKSRCCKIIDFLDEKGKQLENNWRIMGKDSFFYPLKQFIQ